MSFSRCAQPVRVGVFLASAISRGAGSPASRHRPHDLARGPSDRDGTRDPPQLSRRRTVRRGADSWSAVQRLGDLPDLRRRLRVRRRVHVLPDLLCRSLPAADGRRARGGEGRDGNHAPLSRSKRPARNPVPREGRSALPTAGPAVLLDHHDQHVQHHDDQYHDDQYHDDKHHDDQRHDDHHHDVQHVDDQHHSADRRAQSPFTARVVRAEAIRCLVRR